MKSIKEQYFNTIIEEETGLKLGKDYFFVLGTHSPYMGREGLDVDHSNPMKGFAVLKIDKNTETISGTQMRYEPPYTIYENLTNIIKFLKSK